MNEASAFDPPSGSQRTLAGTTPAATPTVASNIAPAQAPATELPRPELAAASAGAPAALAAALSNSALLSITGEQVAAPVVAQTIRNAMAERGAASKGTPQASGRPGFSPQPGSTSTAAPEAQTSAVRAQAGAGSGSGDPLAPAAVPVTSQPGVLEAAENAPEPTGPEVKAPEAAPSSTPASAETRSASVPVRGSPETVASLAAEIARKLEARNSRFEVALDPLGLGVVNVSIDIGADGRLSAQMAFERPEAAAELRSRGAELQRALEQAGFDLSKGGLSFEHGQGRERPSGDQPQSRNGGQQARAQAFQAALLQAESADNLPALPLRLRDRAGLDVRI
ncbi:MAG: flagellar hook-length control protein FliK [Proteobacteria bacterium]|nr:flagellar hook-length control protein FliK [Pseudomonadota bacterium]